MEQLRLDEQERRQAAREGRQVNEPVTSRNEGYWAYMQRQMQERTQKLGLMGENMDKLEENSNSWANDVNKYIQTQKRKAVLGGKHFNFPSIYCSSKFKLTKPNSDRFKVRFMKRKLHFTFFFFTLIDSLKSIANNDSACNVLLILLLINRFLFLGTLRSRYANSN